MDFKCKNLDCKYNKCYICTAKSVIIKNNLICETYEFRNNNSESQNQDLSKDMFLKKPKISKYKDIRKIDLKCKAKRCLFNNNGECLSNGVTICSYKNKPFCITSIKEK